MMIDTIDRSPTVGVTEYSVGNGAVLGTVAALTTPAVCTLYVDGAAMVAGTEMLVQIYEKAVSGGTQRVVASFYINGTMVADAWPLGVLMYGYDVTIKKTAGADTAMPMSLRRQLGTSNVVQWLSTAAATPTVAGIPKTEVASYLSGQAPLQPTVSGRTIDVSAGGEAGIDFANIGSPTTVVALSGTTIKTATDVKADTADIQSRIPAALSAGNMKVDVFALQTASLAQITAAIAAKVVTVGNQTIGGIIGHVAFSLWGKRAGQNGPSLTISNDAVTPVAEIVQAVATDGSTASIPTTLNNP